MCKNRALHSNMAALYMRLSKEDDKGAESTSIETQRKILRAFAESHSFCVYREYVDDGWSGTNLERPAFLQMQNDIENGKVNVVLTKDLSRLGRNSGRVGILIDEYFPKHRVRYISVGEGIDTFRKNITNSIVTPVQNFANELYAADISNKIHAAFDVKIKEGEYIGSFPPYGYRKDPTDKNHLLPDPVSSGVVRKIFEYAGDGYSPSQIADVLNKQKIPTPLSYRYSVNPALNCGRLCETAEWRAAGIGKILRNEVYLGHTLQGKTEKPSFKSTYVRSKPKAEWTKVENTHKAIVDEETWQIVRKKVGSRTRKRESGFVNLFSGLARCADCGKNMSTTGTRKKGATANLNCGGYKLGGTARCSNHSIDYDDLYNAVLMSLKKYVNLTYDEKERIAEDMMNQNKENLRAKEEYCEQKLLEVKNKTKRLFDNRSFDVLDAEQFDELLEKFRHEKKEYERKLAEAKRKTEAESCIADAKIIRREYFDFAEKFCELNELDSEILFVLIDRIDVHRGTYINGAKEQRIDIYFKFKCETDMLEF